MTGVLMSVPGVDFQLHNSVFLIAHFHNTIIGGVVFGLFAGYNYWFPKMFGFKLNETLGKCAFWCWVVGFFMAFMPLYVLGLMGMTRRINHYSVESGYHPYLVFAMFGAFVILLGIIFQVVQLIVSIKQRNQNRDLTGDAWDGRTLEWSIPSPAPFYNFAVEPVVDDRDPFWKQKQMALHNKAVPMKPHYTDIHMPRNTSLGFIVGLAAGVFGFGMIWEMPLVTGFGALVVIVGVIARTFNFDTDYYVPAAEVAKTEAALRGVSS
jgi:cytochrome o ubiquinol oxidase subunit 1